MIKPSSVCFFLAPRHVLILNVRALSEIKLLDTNFRLSPAYGLRHSLVYNIHVYRDRVRPWCTRPTLADFLDDKSTLDANSRVVKERLGGAS